MGDTPCSLFVMSEYYPPLEYKIGSLTFMLKYSPHDFVLKNPRPNFEDENLILLSFKMSFFRTICDITCKLAKLRPVKFLEFVRIV